LRKMIIGWLLQGPTPSLNNVMNSRRLMLTQNNDNTLSRNDGVVCCTSRQNWVVDFR
jgi:hypothetical protein